MKKILISEDELIKLRLQGFTYSEIAEYFNKKGIKVSSVTIRNKMDAIFQSQRSETPKGELKKMVYIDEEEIYKLRNDGKTYSEIAKYFENKGIRVSVNFIKKRCKIIYAEKGENEPDDAKLPVSDKQLIELIEQGFSFLQIAKYFSSIGIALSSEKVAKRCKEICRENKITISRRKVRWKPLDSVVINERALEIALQNLKNSRKATDIQLQSLARIYNIEWNYSIDSNDVEDSTEER